MFLMECVFLMECGFLGSPEEISHCLDDICSIVLEVRHFN